MTVPLFFSTLVLAGGLIIFLMGLVILRESPRSPVNRATALMLFSGALGTVLGGLGRLLAEPMSSGAAAEHASTLRNFAYLWEFFFPSLLYFAVVYPRRLVADRNLHLVEAGLYVPHLTHMALVLFFTEATDVTREFDPLLQRFGPGLAGGLVATTVEILGVLVVLVRLVHQQLFSLVNFAYAALAIYLLARSRKATASTRVRGPLGVVLVGLTLCVVSYAAARLLPVLFPFRPSGGLEALLTSLALLVASVAIGFAIVRYKFLDIRNVARRSILYAATAVVFAVAYLLVLRQVSRLAAGAFGSNLPVLEAGLLVFSLMIFQPLLLGLEDLLESLLRRRDRTDPQRLMQELSRDLASQVDLAGIRTRVAVSVERGLLVDGIRLLIIETREDGLWLDDGARAEAEPAGSGLEALVGFFEAAPEPALRHDVEHSLGPLPEVDRERIQGWIQDYRLLVPIFQQGRLRGVLGVGAKVTGGRFHAEDVAMLALLGQQIAVSLENLRLVSENVAKRLLEEEIQLASEIQKGLLPTHFPQSARYATHAMSVSSKEVGGDYFDIFDDGRVLHVAIADVSGKGVPAAILMSYLRAALRSNVQHLHSPAEVLSRINNLLYESTSPEKFATFFYGTLDTEAHELVYANAGHNYPIVVGADGRARELTDGGLLLGAFPDLRYEDGRLRLEPGETLFLYTDGVTEATDGTDEEFGSTRLMDLLANAAECPPCDLVNQVLGTVREFCHGMDIADDVTMVAVRRAGDAPGVAA